MQPTALLVRFSTPVSADRSRRPARGPRRAAADASPLGRPNPVPPAHEYTSPAFVTRLMCGNAALPPNGSLCPFWFHGLRKSRSTSNHIARAHAGFTLARILRSVLHRQCASITRRRHETLLTRQTFIASDAVLARVNGSAVCAPPSVLTV
jgi:hypothetical protein